MILSETPPGQLLSRPPCFSYCSSCNFLRYLESREIVSCFQRLTWGMSEDTTIHFSQSFKSRWMRMLYHETLWQSFRRILSKGKCSSSLWTTSHIPVEYQFIWTQCYSRINIISSELLITLPNKNSSLALFCTRKLSGYAQVSCNVHIYFTHRDDVYIYKNASQNY